MDSMESQNQSSSIIQYDLSPEQGSSQALILSAGDEGSPDDLTTNMETFMNILKVNLGTGILNAGAAFSNGGLYFSPFMVFFLGFCILYNMIMLLDVGKYAREKYGKKYISFPDLHVYLLEPFIGKYARVFHKIVIFALIICQYGCCCVYLLFVAETFVSINVSAFSNIKLVLLVLTILVIPFSFVSQLNWLAIVSSIANGICSFSLVSTIVGVFMQSPVNSSVAVAPLSKIPLFVSSVVFAFEGIGSVLPMEHKTQNPASYQRLLTVALAISFLMYLFMGFIGYYMFGSNIQSSITMNLPDIVFFKVIRVMYAVGIFLSLFIQLYVGVDVILPGILGLVKDKKYHKIAEYSTRIFGAVISGVFAILIPNLSLMISLVGSVTSSLLTFILPACLHFAMMISLPSRGLQFYASCTKNILIMILGLAVSVIGIYCSIIDIIHHYSSSPQKS